MIKISTKSKYFQLTALAALVAGLAPGLADLAVAQTADGEAPASEDVCADLEGVQYGQCNAYCEAMDCHLGDGIRASATACDKALERYRAKFAEDPPCISGNCASRCIAEAMDYFGQCMAKGIPELKCAGIAKKYFSMCFNDVCPRECYDACMDQCLGGGGSIKVCSGKCRPECYPRYTCSGRCDQQHGNALFRCALDYNIEQCGGEPECEAINADKLAACDAAANASHQACLVACEPAPGDVCSKEDEECGGFEVKCQVDGVPLKGFP